MFKSLKSWANLDAIIRPFITYTGTGAKVFGNNLSIKCYAEGKVVVTKNSAGEEVVSNKQLYVDGNTQVYELDHVLFEGLESSVQSIGYFYRGGKVDLKVVYL